MSFNKVIFVAALACLGFAFVKGQSHIINDCLEPGVTPTVIYDQEVSKAGAFLQTQEETIRVPAVGFSPSDLTCITVTNLNSDDGGYPKVLEGGVGKLYATINLKSQFGKGFDFRVTVYYDKSSTARSTDI